MKKKYNTIEELRAARTERQRRWRAKSGGAERLAMRNAYWAKRVEQIVGLVLAELERRGHVASEDDVKKEEVRERVVSGGGTIVEPVEGYDVPSTEYVGRQAAFKERREGGAVVAAVGRSGDEHARAVARLEELKARQARGGLNAGVEVELEI